MKTRILSFCISFIIIVIVFIGKTSFAQSEQTIQSKTITVKGVSFNMIRVEGGDFWMGAQSSDPKGINYDEEAWDDISKTPTDYEGPVHKVTLSTFYIAETEVTQELWEAVMYDNPSYNKGKNLPVESIDWFDCQTFVQELSNKTGLRFRLPTEAEWEYAARGGNNSNHYKFAGSNDINEVGVFLDHNSAKTYPVKTKKPNELGIYDMSGNVTEWCEDRFDYYSASDQINPNVQSSNYDESARVIRGACIYIINRIPHRGNWAPFNKKLFCGMRLVLVD